ncbi:MAG: hypothetical protein WB562_06990, partial [Candidatus Sulfotelmatobacter sp.]
GGVVLLPVQRGAHPTEMVGGGKQGTLYLVNRDNMGGYNPAGDSQIIQSIVGASTGELDSVPAYWNGKVYISGNNDYIKAFSLSNGLLSPTPTSQTSVQFNQFGPGAVSISSNGRLAIGIVWALLHSNATSILYAFDASNLATELYDSRQATAGRDSILGVPQFVTPTVANGKVYVGGTNLFYVYGLLPSLVPAAGNNQSGYLGTTLPVPLEVEALDAYTRKPIPNISLTCKDGGARGTFGSSLIVTNAQGQASTTYTLPSDPVSITITCSATGFISGTFSETSIPGPPTSILITGGNNQTGPVSTQLPTALSVKVQDAHSYGVNGVTVAFSDGGAGGRFSTPSPVTSGKGQASTNYTTPSATGVVHITATVSGLTPVTFNVTVN